MMHTVHSSKRAFNQNMRPTSVGQNTVELNREKAEKDLLNLLLPPDQVQLQFNEDGSQDWKVQALDSAKAKISYPLDPSIADSWFDDASMNSLLDELSDADVVARSERFFDSMEQLWGDDLATVLIRKFVTVPQAVLKAIAANAEKISVASGEMVDQLINCVQEALPNWAEDDLRVFARPLAYAMRGDAEKTEPTDKDWAALSEVEQAKLTLAIAKYAIDHVAED
jgi:hypothetical protein